MNFNSSWNECNVTEAEAEEALELYLKWCTDNKEEPETDSDYGIEQFEENDSLLGHVVYHAQTFMNMEQLTAEL
jgi:hypothetical protein